MHRPTKKSGFTIVELLIVVVVIAILAAISIVAYTNIQSRAVNSSILATAGQTVGLLRSYIAVNDAYPLTSGDACLVSGASSCTAGGSARNRSTTLDANLRTIGNIPEPMPDARPEYNGIVYSYAASGREMDDTPLHAIVIFSLVGTQQQCGSSSTVLTGSWNDWTTSTSGYSTTGGGYTVCIIAIPGPN